MATHCGCTSSRPLPEDDAKEKPAWTIRYLLILAVLASLWWIIWLNIRAFSGWLVVDLMGVSPESAFGGALQFFLYDTAKILLLLSALIYGIAWLRASIDTTRMRGLLTGRRKIIGYSLAALFGAVTPFCSCSSVPLFLAFSSAGFPIGITMAFLITSPIINEIAVILLGSLLGWKFTLLYVGTGIAAGILGGFVMDGLNAGRWLQPQVLEAAAKADRIRAEQRRQKALTVRQRHIFAYGEMTSIVRRIGKWVLAGVGIGAMLHGFVPENWFAENFGTGQWWTVPAAVLTGIPLYSNVTGIVPIMESLLAKGLPVGTTLAFCLSAVAASIPEVLLLRQVMTLRLQILFLAYLWTIFTLCGWLYNALQPLLF